VTRQPSIAIATDIRGGVAEDQLVTRHDRAFTNLFLPGFWPHAALYVGTETDRRAMGITLDADRASRWTGDRRVLEALRDEVLFRPLEQTLAVFGSPGCEHDLVEGEDARCAIGKGTRAPSPAPP
jgi:hypothetical protein